MFRQPNHNMSEVATQLHKIIKRSPGIHFRSLGREARLSSVGQLRHHLDSLRRKGAIVELEDGRFKRYFVAGEHEPQLRRGLARFSRPIPKRIATLLLSKPMNRTEIRRSLGCADSTLGYHLNRMVELGDLKRERGRNCCMYSLTDPDFIRRLMQYDCGSPQNKPQPQPRRGPGVLDHTRGPLQPSSPTPTPGDHGPDAPGRLPPIAMARSENPHRTGPEAPWAGRHDPVRGPKHTPLSVSRPPPGPSSSDPGPRRKENEGRRAGRHNGHTEQSEEDRAWLRLG